MAFEYLIQEEINTGLNTKSVFVLLRRDDPVGYRRVEVVDVPQSIVGKDNILAHVAGRYSLAELWALGDAVESGRYVRAKDKPRVDPIYRKIVENVFVALQQNDLDVARTAALQLLQQDGALWAQFQAVGQNLGLGSTTQQDKALQLNWIVLLAVVGVLNGALD